MRVPRLFTTALVASLMMPSASIAASTFPDVPDAYPHLQAIEALLSRGIIAGNPDGTFRPTDPVNRAALLKMLYKAAGINATEGQSGCLPDVEKGSWYESIVCDAVARGFVKGYEDSTFRPARPVSRAEALKMTLLVIGKQSTYSSMQIPYTDVDAGAWYATYVRTALEVGILPIPGQDGSTFSPNTPLERGEAAAYIWNALSRGPSTSSSSSAESSSSVSSLSGSGSSSVSSSSSKSSATARIIELSFPFEDIRAFDKKALVSYRFSLSVATLADVKATSHTAGATVTCTLFRLDSGGFSTEYYLGIQNGSVCQIKAALTAGNYQVQLQPSQPDIPFDVSVAGGKGDGNDGFSQAIRLTGARSQTGYLDANDLEDWYVFMVTKEKNITVSLVSTDAQRCLIYPSADVALASFSGPACNKEYLYPVGTYYVGVGHGTPLSTREVYTIQLR